MKFSALSALALPLLGVAAEESQFAQYQAQFQNVLSNVGSSLPPWFPLPYRHDAEDAALAKAEKKITVLTLTNWKGALFEPVREKFKDAADEKEASLLSAQSPEEWWVLITGGNKSCLGRCGQVEAAFNETAAKFATLPTAPHMALLNCDLQPVLCNVFSAGPATLWSVGMEWPGNNITISARRMNVTTTTTETFEDLYKADRTENFKPLDSTWHPFNGWLAQNGVALPIASILWAFSVIPNWATMLFVSFFSRRAMNRRINDPAAGAPRR